MFSRSLTLAVVALFVLLQSCDSPRKQIVGKWLVEGETREVVWEFHPNGSVTTAEAPGRYTFGSGNRLKIQTPSAIFIYELEIHGDRMTWKDSSGAKTELTRLK